MFHSLIPCSSYFFQLREEFINDQKHKEQKHISQKIKLASPKHLSTLRDKVIFSTTNLEDPYLEIKLEPIYAISQKKMFVHKSEQ